MRLGPHRAEQDGQPVCSVRRRGEQEEDRRQRDKQQREFLRQVHETRQEIHRLGPSRDRKREHIVRSKRLDVIDVKQQLYLGHLRRQRQRDEEISAIKARHDIVTYERFTEPEWFDA